MLKLLPSFLSLRTDSIFFLPLQIMANRHLDEKTLVDTFFLDKLEAVQLQHEKNIYNSRQIFMILLISSKKSAFIFCDIVT